MKKLLNVLWKRIAKNKSNRVENLKIKIEKKDEKFYVKWKDCDNSFNTGYIKRYGIDTSHKIIKHFPKLYECSDRSIKIDLNLSNYATKADLKRATGADSHNLAVKKIYFV